MDMPTFKGDCPRCGTRSVMFAIELQHDVRIPAHGKCDVLARCGHCARGVVATYFGVSGNPLSKLVAKRKPFEISPSVPATRAPLYTPVNAAGFYRQGMENLPGNPDAAGAMFRKTLETALKKKFPDLGKMNLATRIAEAAKVGGLTPDLAAWADQIRFDGNDATHDEITAGQAQDMQVFTELVLRYLFELPGMLKKAQKRTRDKDNGNA